MNINMIFLATVDRVWGTAVMCSQQIVAKQICCLVSYHTNWNIFHVQGFPFRCAFWWFVFRGYGHGVTLSFIWFQDKTVDRTEFHWDKCSEKNTMWKNLTVGIQKCLAMQHLSLTSVLPRYFSQALVFSASPAKPIVQSLFIQVSPVLLFYSTFSPEVQR